MAQPWPSAVGRFNEGLVGGMQVANQRKQLEMQRNAQELERAFQSIEVNSKLLANKAIPDAMKSKVMTDTVNAYNFVGKRVNPNHKDMVFDGNLEPTDVDFAKRAGGLVEQWKNKELEDSHFKEAFSSLTSDIFKKNEPADAQRILTSQVVPTLEQGVVSGSSLSIDTPLMQALRGTSPEKAKELEGRLKGENVAQLYSEYIDPKTPEQARPEMLNRIALLDPKFAQQIEKDKAVDKRLSTEVSRTQDLRFKDIYRAAQQDQAVKDFRNIQILPNRIARATEAYKKTGEAGVLDDSILYALNKMNDPNSVVMIGEYMRTAGLQSWWDGVQGKIGKLTRSNAGISSSFRGQLLEAVNQAIADKAKIYDDRMSYYREWGSDFESKQDRLKRAFPLSSEIYGKGIDNKESATTRKSMTFNPSTGVFE